MVASNHILETFLTVSVHHDGWLVFNSTFSTKRLYCAMRKLNVC